MRSLTVAALTTHLLPELAPLPIAAWRAIRNLPDEEVVPFATRNLPGRDRDLIQARLNQIDDYERALDQFAQADLKFVTEFEPDYPQSWHARLGDKVPAHLFVAGNLELLNATAVGVVGSRELDSVGERFTREVGASLSDLGYAVISGGARGVDEIAMRAAFESGGTAVGIMADSLLKAAKKWDIDSGRICLASPFAPTVGFQVANAMGRNKLIYAGSKATIVVSSALESGGTWAGAVEAIRGNLCPVLVRDGAGVPDGNKKLFQLGGIRLPGIEGLAKTLETCQPVQGSLL